ncbi:MAG: transketolase [Bdellovibrio sp. ArHS]|uniref:transketolase family protein n=1 Tax=Bdellovibrio sp. ArHS TaxID=1569284 RepID=UPI00058341E8|nr:transketolase C-terminal domain-containing protein [Bdellovibrio sp. ArHS]KHD90000.1 MAG: transketolase [Bdellovibrio sp. ArHS]
MRDQFIKTLTELAEKDPKIFLITGDLGFGVLTDFAKRFPNQFLNIGVAEQNMAGVAAGIALEGRTVYIYSIGNFPSLRCLEQIRNDACYHNANVKVVCIGGGFSYGALGMSHHATEDLAIMRSLPGVKVFAPSDLWETAEATKATASTPGVCYLRLDKSKADTVPLENESFKFGKLRTLKQGSSLALLSVGGITEVALEVSKKLDTLGISSSVISVHTLKPFDDDGLKDVIKNHKYLVTIEEHNLTGGLAGAVAESALMSQAYPSQFLRIGLQDTYSSVVGSQNYLRKYYNMDAEYILNRILKMVH